MKAYEIIEAMDAMDALYGDYPMSGRIEANEWDTLLDADYTPATIEVFDA